MKKKTMNSTNIEPTPTELERQKDAFIDKLIEIIRKQSPRYSGDCLALSLSKFQNVVA